MKILVVFLVVCLTGFGSTAEAITLVEQERFLWETTYNGSDDESSTTFFAEATDFSPFSVQGPQFDQSHVSTLSSDLLTGELVARGHSDGYPQINIDTIVSFRVVFDLLEPRTVDLDGYLETQDAWQARMAEASLALSLLDTGSGSFQPIFSQVATDHFDLFTVDERFHDLPAGRYQLEATATGKGFYDSQGDRRYGRAFVEFSLTVPEPQTGLLLCLALCAAMRLQRQSFGRSIA